MGQRSRFKLIIILALLTLSCQVFDNLGLTASRPTPTNEIDSWPHSAFTQMILLGEENAPTLPFGVYNLPNAVIIGPTDPTDLPPGLVLPQETALVPRGQAVQIDTIHLTPDQLDSVAIFINDQPVRGEETAPGEPFPEGYVNLLVVSGDRLVRTGVFRPQWPTREEKLSLVWVGLIPGTYELSLEARDKPADEDNTPRPGQRIVQRIEVQDPAQ